MAVDEAVMEELFEVAKRIRGEVRNRAKELGLRLDDEISMTNALIQAYASRCGSAEKN